DGPRAALRIAHDHAGFDATFFRLEVRMGGCWVWSFLRAPRAEEQVPAGQIAWFLPELRELSVLSRSRTRRPRRGDEQSHGRCENDQNLTHLCVIASTLRAIDAAGTSSRVRRAAER